MAISALLPRRDIGCVARGIGMRRPRAEQQMADQRGEEDFVGINL